MIQPFTILAERFWPDVHGGVETRLFHMARELAQRGIVVNVLTERRSDAPPREELMPGLFVRRFARMDCGRLWRWRNLVRVQWWRRNLHDCLSDAGHIWATHPASALAVIALGHRDRLIYNPAACTAGMRHIFRVHPHITTMRMPHHLCVLDRLAYRLSHRTIVSSRNLARQFTCFYGVHDRPPAVLPLAARTADLAVLPNRSSARRRWNLPDDGLVLGYVGRLDPCKGIDVLLEAMASQPLRPTTRLLLVGEGPDEARLRTLVDQLHLSRHVIFTGRLDDPSHAYSAIDLLAMPSHYEAFGLAAVEAMAMGVPVLAPRGNDRDTLTAFDEIIEHERTGWLVDANHPAALATVIHALERAPGQCRLLGDNARRQMSQRSWRQYVSECLEMLTSSHDVGNTSTAPLASIAAHARSTAA